MTMIWGAGMIIVMIMAIKICCIAKKNYVDIRKNQKIRKHLHLKDTEEQQEEDDQNWKDLVADKYDRPITKPNPRRNYELLNRNQEAIQRRRKTQ